MLAELFQKVFDRLDTRHTSSMERIVDPKTGAETVGYFGANGAWCAVAQGYPSKGFKFPKVTVHSAESLIRYAVFHAEKAIENERALLRVNKSGLFLTIDYGANEAAEERDHNVSFPAAFDEECEGAAAALKVSMGKWIQLDQFDALIDKCAPFLVNFTALEEAASNMEGHETAKIAKTKTSYQVIVTGEVSCAVDIPKAMQISLIFMGHPIAFEIPLRLTVESKQVKFHLVDNGALASATSKILKAIRDEVSERLPELLAIEGSIA